MFKIIVNILKNLERETNPKKMNQTQPFFIVDYRNTMHIFCYCYGVMVQWWNILLFVGINMFISYNCNVNINIQKTFLTMFEIKVIVDMQSMLWVIQEGDLLESRNTISQHMHMIVITLIVVFLSFKNSTPKLYALMKIVLVRIHFLFI